MVISMVLLFIPAPPKIVLRSMFCGSSYGLPFCVGLWNAFSLYSFQYISFIDYAITYLNYMQERGQTQALSALFTKP